MTMFIDAGVQVAEERPGVSGRAAPQRRLRAGSVADQGRSSDAGYLRLSRPTAGRAGRVRSQDPVVFVRSGVPHGARDRSRSVEDLGWLIGVAGMAFLVVLLFGFVAARTGDASVPPRTIQVQMQAGQTLWGLAGRFAPDGDRQAVVQRIVRLNALDGSAARVGQSLVVPVG